MSSAVICRRGPIARCWGPAVSCVVLFIVFLTSSSPTFAARPSASEPNDLQSQIAAGEFAPALAQVRKLPKAPQRDEQLASVAAAQTRAGATNQALATAAEIADDDTRYRTLQELGKSANRPAGAFGGTQADFDSLIELIETTIAPTTWDTVGGPGSMQGFEGGVYCDPEGVLQPAFKEDRSGKLAALRRQAQWRGELPRMTAGKSTPLRKVSLVRLERQVQRRLAEGKSPTEEMRTLAGIHRVKYVLVYPNDGDIVLAGPAGAWKEDHEGRILNVQSGEPVLQLDDLLVLLRHATSNERATFGCSITPTQEGLARTKAFVAESNKRPLKPGQQAAWLAQLRNQLGLQTIEIYGIEPDTRVARVLVEADYRMKLVGLGLEEPVLGVRSYLSSLVVKPGEAPPPMDVLRWWFTLNYDAIVATPDQTGYEIRGQGVKVLSENEMLTITGQRVHTGESSPANTAYTSSFTEHFPQLCEKYPVYADLRNIFDLAMVAALLKSERLPEKIDWRMSCFGDPDQYQVARGTAPKAVQTVIAHRVVNRTQIVVGVSGGVSVNPATYVAADAIKRDDYGAIAAERTRAKAKNDAIEAWWWD